MARGGGGREGLEVLSCRGYEATKREQTRATLEGQHARGCGAGLVGVGEETVDEGVGAWSGLRSQHDGLDDADVRRAGGGEREQAVDTTAERSGHFSGGDACLWLCLGLVCVYWFGINK